MNTPTQACTFEWTYSKHPRSQLIIMSTLEYLDDGGSVKSFGLVPWKTLHTWLSIINGASSSTSIPRGVNRGKILEELEARRKGQESFLVHGALRVLNMDRGYEKDWREYENDQHGLTHLEELLVYQPKDWRKQAREYFFRFDCNLARESCDQDLRTVVVTVGGSQQHHFFLKSPILVVLFHPSMARTARYEPLNFLLAYGVVNPLPALVHDADMDENDRQALMEDLSPLDYFLEFQNYVSSYRLDKLKRVGKSSKVPRLRLIKELDFCDIVGQRLAKQLIRQSVVSHIWNRSNNGRNGGGMCAPVHPLSMIFAGPSGIGKTELAHCIAKLLNKPGDDYFIKVDCGKLTDASEVFGMSGAYQGAKQGSALNNFVLKMSLEEDAIGIVLLDELEKASQGVIHALYQVIDKGEWTNKRLSSGGSQTDVIPCDNLIFIMTTNACDFVISDFVKSRPEIYNIVGDDVDEIGSELGSRIRGTLQFTHPFTEAFLGRIDRIVPFLPMANGDPETHGVLSGESMAVTKLLIERQQEQMSGKDDTTIDEQQRRQRVDGNNNDVQQMISARTKHQMARMVVRQALPEAGVRALQKGVQQRMGDRIMNALLLEKGGIEDGSIVRYYAIEDWKEIDFRVEDVEETTSAAADQTDQAAEENGHEDLDLYE